MKNTLERRATEPPRFLARGLKSRGFKRLESIREITREGGVQENSPIVSDLTPELCKHQSDAKQHTMYLGTEHGMDHCPDLKLATGWHTTRTNLNNIAEL